MTVQNPESRVQSQTVSGSRLSTLNSGLEDELSLDIRKVLGLFIQHLGGPEGVAKEMALDYKANKAGESNRIRLLSDVLKLMMQFSDEEPVKEDELEDLEAVAKDLLKSPA